MKLDLPEVEEDNDIVAALGSLPGGAIIYEPALAKLFDRSRRTIKRAVKRGELPAPTRLFGQSAWTARTILNHIESRIQHNETSAAADRADLDDKIRSLRPGGRATS